VTGVAACIVLSLVLVVAFRQRPAVWVSAGMLTAVFFPVVATRAWFWEAGAAAGRIHPATLIFLMGFLVTTLSTPVRRAAPKVRTAVVLAIGLWVAATGLLVLRDSGTDNLGALVVYYLTPPLAFLAIHAAAAREDGALWAKLVPVVLVAAALESVLALVQYFTHNSILYGQYYATQYWWDSYVERSLGTLDNPLDLAAFLTMAIPLTAALRRTPVALILAGLLATGVVASGSRTGVVLAAVAIVWIILVRSSNVIPAILTLITVGLAVAVLLSSALATTLLRRFGFDGETSTQVRVDALTTGLDLATSSGFSGHGLGYAYTYSAALLSSSFENGYLATAIDLGPAVAVELILIQLWAVVSGPSTQMLFRVPGFMAVVWGLAYSSFVSTNTFGTVSWIFIALSAIAGSKALPVANAYARPRSRRALHLAGPALSGSSLGKR
jgi:hypothetical protein